VVVEGHETPASWVTPLGTLWLVHVVPPSEVVRMAPDGVGDVPT
jgi:hypothetical protein